MRTGHDYRLSLRDGRRNYLDGELVEDAAEHRLLRNAVDHIARSFDVLAARQDGPCVLYLVPRSVEDLRFRSDGLEELDVTCLTTSQSLLALRTAASDLAVRNAEYGERIFAYSARARSASLRLAECVTDAKGDRSLSPSRQHDPDLYVRVVQRSDDGVVIRGAKMHVTGAGLVDDLMVMPTKSMKPGEEDYAIACVVPVNAPGVTIINTTYAPRHDDVRSFPASGVVAFPEGTVVFEDVFVPNKHVFLDGEVTLAARFAHALGLWERYGSVAEMARHADLFVGLASLIAEANGLAKVPHIKEKIGEMAVYATLIRSGYEAALANAVTSSDGVVHPSELYTNAAKYYGAVGYHISVRHLQDIAGGAVVTAPSVTDFESSEVGHLVQKYIRAGPADGAGYRLRLLHLIRDLTADALGGWHLVTNLFAGGGLFAQRLMTLKHYDLDHAREMALNAAKLSPLPLWVEDERR